MSQLHLLASQLAQAGLRPSQQAIAPQLGSLVQPAQTQTQTPPPQIRPATPKPPEPEQGASRSAGTTDNVMQALRSLEMPQAPQPLALPQAPGAPAPGRGAFSANPQMLAALMQALQGSASTPTNTLAQLMSPTTTGTITLG